VIAAGKLPLMLCFVSFVVTFVSTRTITRPDFIGGRPSQPDPLSSPDQLPSPDPLPSPD
jgi:hypothetical protein